MNYLPGTPSPTFPGLQPSILQSGGEENFQIDFLHDSDVRGTCMHVVRHGAHFDEGKYWQVGINKNSTNRNCGQHHVSYS